MNNTKHPAETTTEIHPFEKRGLGKAPFRFAGQVVQDLAYGEVCLNRAEFDKTGILVSTKQGGTCEYCGQGIMRMYRIRSADGREFVVGCECVRHTGDAKLIARVDAARRATDRKARAAKATSVRGSLEATLADESKRAVLAYLPHPKASMAAQGGTLLGWAEWMLAHAGAAGLARVAKAVAAALAR